MTYVSELSKAQHIIQIEARVCDVDNNLIYNDSKMLHVIYSIPDNRNTPMSVQVSGGLLKTANIEIS